MNMNWQIGEWVILRPLWLIPTLLLLTMAFMWRVESERNQWRQVLSPALMRYLGAASHRSSHCNLLLVIAAMTTLSFSQPAHRQSDDDTWRHSIGWLVLADVSRSMTLDDTVPSRLAGMREALAELSRQAAARPIALILFSGDAFLVAPPAFDRSVFNEHSALLQHGVIPMEGSNLARALSLASSVINDSQLLKARVFVLGDSGGIGDSSLAAARFLADSGHRVDTLTFGSSEPGLSTSQNVQGSATSGDSKNSSPSEGRDVVVNWKQVQALSEAGNGLSLRANSFGVIDYRPLDLDWQSTASTHAELKSLVWREQSHWIQLLSLPLLLLLFRRESAL